MIAVFFFLSAFFFFSVLSNIYIVLVLYKLKNLHLLTELVHLGHPTQTLGGKDDAMVRALASHQCGPGSIPNVDSICGLSLLLVLSLAPRGFSLGTSVSPLLKNQHFQIPILAKNQVDGEPLSGCGTSKSLFLFIYVFFYLFILLMSTLAF